MTPFTQKQALIWSHIGGSPAATGNEVAESPNNCRCRGADSVVPHCCQQGRWSVIVHHSGDCRPINKAWVERRAVATLTQLVTLDFSHSTGGGARRATGLTQNTQVVLSNITTSKTQHRRCAPNSVGGSDISGIDVLVVQLVLLAVDRN